MKFWLRNAAVALIVAGLTQAWGSVADISLIAAGVFLIAATYSKKE
jgi:hypothetical protein